MHSLHLSTNDFHSEDTQVSSFNPGDILFVSDTRWGKNNGRISNFTLLTTSRKSFIKN